VTALSPGALLGRYEVRRELGRGGMGAVYEAVHVDLGKRVAVKTLLPTAEAHEELRARFVREGRISARVEHPHVVQVLDVGAEGGLLYLVMEYLEGEDLKALLARSGRLSATDALDLLLPVMAGVAEAHREGVVHRDLKPANLFLQRSRDGLVAPKVLDFGIARMLDPGQGELTQTKFAIGSVGYMSPEQVQSARRVDAACDQYALGAVLYHCLTGRKAFSGELTYELMTAVIRGEFPPPRALAPELPAALEQVILRAMHTDPGGRFASVVELGRALLPFASPTARARWLPVFGAPGPDSSVPPAPAPHGGSPAGTLSAAATTLPGARREGARGARARAAFGVVALASLGLIAAGVVALRARAAPSPVAAIARPVAAPLAPVAAPPAPAPPAPAPPAPVARAPVAPAEPPVAAPPPAEQPAEEVRGRRRRARSSRRSGRGEPAASPSAHGTNAMPILE
jgi:hypothetical protein